MLINDDNWHNDEFLKSLTVDQAANLSSNAVYSVCHLYERLEGAGKIHGNGHHMQQKIAAAAEILLRDQWK
jgi:hypothetical protein